MKRSCGRLCVLFILCLSLFLLTSCAKEVVEKPRDTDPTPAPETVAPSLTEGEEPIPQSEVVDYQALLGEWSSYLAYSAPKEAAHRALFTLPENGVCTSVGESFLEVRIPFSEGERSGTRISVYNLSEGLTVLENLESVTGQTQYALRYSGAVIEVAATSSEGAVNYTYYDSKGASLLASPSEASLMSEYESSGYTFTTVGERCYLAKGNTLLGDFAAGEEHILPEADLTFGGYRYSLLGEEISVFDESGRLLVRYGRSEIYRDAKAEVLSDGRVMLFAATPAEGETSDATVKDREGSAWRLSLLLIDPATGKTIEKTPAYHLAEGRMITHADGRGSSLAPKGDYQYAEIYKISGGVLASEATPVILDNEMQVVAELPLILKNQETLLGATDENHLMISADVAEVECFYLINLVTCKTTLYPNPASSDYLFLRGAFLWEDTLYNTNMNERYDLRDSDYEILGGRVVIWSEGKSILLSVEDGALTPVSLGESRALYNGDCDLYDVLSGEGRMLYDGNGELLCACRSIELLFVTDGATVFRCSQSGGWVYYILQ